nr:MAG TPA: Terminase large subunit [Caudoviricetes sp.]
MKQTDSGIWVPDTPTIFVKPTEEIISQRKMEGMQKLSEIKQWGLRNPTKFMERFIGVDLLDVQTYTFMNSWDKMYALWLCTRNYGKSTLLALYYMTRGMLLNNCRCYICAGTSDQSIETFEKIVSIAKNEIESFTGLTDVFRNEVVINMTNNDGFIRNPAGFTYRLYNGSFVKTLNSNVNAKRGKRAEAVCFDESGFLDEEVFQVIEPYTAQDKNFKMGGSVNVTTLPKELPNQLLYTSSASTTDSYFYKKYKEYSKAMIWGSKDHFVADINCEIMFNATYRGKIYPASLLTKEKVDNAMRENKEKALREYYNIFTSDGGADAIFKRSMIVKNSTIRPPIMFNDTKDRLFALAYDPARSMDNSFVLVGEYYKDSSDNWRMRIANGINFMDLSKKNKTPMRTPEQVKKLKQLILDYNGDGVDDYTNISNIFIDAGSGGAGVNIADYLMEDWYEEGHEGEQKYLHRGLIDKEQSSDYVKKFPNAVNKIKLLPPTMYKSIIYEAAIEMMRLDLIDFTAEYDNKGYLTMLDIDEKEMAKAKKDLIAKYKDKSMSKGELDRLVEEELQERNLASTKIYKLSPDEELGLVQIDSLKEEMVNMVRKKRESGKDGFELSTEKQNKLHDDRSYCFSMLCYGLSELRREHIKNKKRPKKENIAAAMPIRKGVVRKMFS